MGRTSFLVRRHSADVATYDSEADALVAIRQDLSSMEPQAIALSGFELVKRDERGRAKRRWSSRELAAHVLGQPVESLGPWLPLPVEQFEAAVSSSRDLSFEITQDSDGWVLRAHFQRVDDRGNPLGRDKLFLAWDRSRAALESRSLALMALAAKVAPDHVRLSRRDTD